MNQNFIFLKIFFFSNKFYKNDSLEMNLIVKLLLLVNEIHKRYFFNEFYF